MKKKIFSLFLALALLCTLLPQAVLPFVCAEDSIPIDEAHFPDERFRDYLYSEIDGNHDHKLSASERLITEIWCNFYGISSLAGIEYFPALKTLSCDISNISTLDLSKNTSLEKLECRNHCLTTLNLSKNTALKELYCSENQLTALDVSKCTALKMLECYGNQLTELDVSNNAALEKLECHYNLLTSINLSKNPLLELALKEGKKDDNGAYLQYWYYPNGGSQYLSVVFDTTTSIRLSDGTIFNQHFGDVSLDDYFYNPVMWAVNHDPAITGGVDDTHFGPKKNCTREQIVTFLWKANGAPEPNTTENPFTDVRKTKYYYKPVLWAVENGVTKGVGNGRFGVNNTCTRAQIITFLYMAEQIKG